MTFKIGYDNTEAQEMMTLSAIAYAGESTNNYPQIQDAIAGQIQASPTLGGNFRLVWLGISPDWANLVYIAQDTRHTARFAVVVRGTDWDFLTDWVDDFDVLGTTGWPTASPPNGGIQVAQGSWDGLQALLATTSNVFGMTPPAGVLPTTLIDLFGGIALSSTYDTDVDIFVTGHSLGGAMATVLGLWLADTVSTWKLRPHKVNLKSYTFAAPTVGNQAFANYYNGQTANTQVQWQAFRIFNEQDAIPHGYADLAGIAHDGVPLEWAFRDFELIPTLDVIRSTLWVAGVRYVDVGVQANGTARGLNNVPPSTQYPPSEDGASGHADSFETFGHWVAYEHDHNLYLTLLGAPVVPVEQAAVNVASIASLPMHTRGAAAELVRTLAARRHTMAVPPIASTYPEPA
ncbi:MAG TPA: lipase family protein [Longimicrobium sp.]|nr:lipase family protein [Longimicrobium sp.]